MISMIEQKEALLLALREELEAYRLMDVSHCGLCLEKKSFIKGLMVACRIVGVTYAELDCVVIEVMGVSFERELQHQTRFVFVDDE